jgi:hypothetical protein
MDAEQFVLDRHFFECLPKHSVGAAVLIPEDQPKRHAKACSAKAVPIAIFSGFGAFESEHCASWGQGGGNAGKVLPVGGNMLPLPPRIAAFGPEKRGDSSCRVWHISSIRCRLQPF